MIEEAWRSGGDRQGPSRGRGSWSTLKAELVENAYFPTRRAARGAIFDFIEVFYNRQRIHSALGYLAPVAYENLALAAAAAA